MIMWAEEVVARPVRAAKVKVEYCIFGGGFVPDEYWWCKECVEEKKGVVEC